MLKLGVHKLDQLQDGDDVAFFGRLKKVNRSQFVRRLKELVLDALLMAVSRRKPTSMVTVYSDQGSQYTSHDWQNFLETHGLQASMSRRGNCHDNAVAESFFQLLKRERVKRHIYSTRNDARSGIVDYIEMFHKSKRRHSFNNLLSPVEGEYLEDWERFNSHQGLIGLSEVSSRSSL